MEQNVAVCFFDKYLMSFFKFILIQIFLNFYAFKVDWHRMTLAKILFTFMRSSSTSQQKKISNTILERTAVLLTAAERSVFQCHSFESWPGSRFSVELHPTPTLSVKVRNFWRYQTELFRKPGISLYSSSLSTSEELEQFY